MRVFIDTSAFYALLDRDDANHQRAKDVWTNLLKNENTLLTSNYVLVETFALVQHRLGIEAVRGF
jgi:predicted nucleic acid-binding protein